MSDATQLHGAYPATVPTPDWRHGVTDRCAGCGQAIEYTVRPDRPEYGAQAGRGGWRHITRRLRQVAPHHLHEMAVLVSEAARDRAYTVLEGKGAALDNPEYLRARARHERRMKALTRLTSALERRLDEAEARR